MKAINIFVVLFITTFTVSCSSVYDVKYDYDKQANFKDVKTFDWLTVPEKPGINSLVVERVKDAVNAELKAKGLMMSSNNPDFLIAQHLGKKDKVHVTNMGYGYGSYGGYWGGHWGTGGGVATYNYEEGSLILDFVDAKSKKLIWRGAANAEVQDLNTPEKSEKVINEVVKEILKNYPPSLSK